MNKRAPKKRELAVMILFAFSVFAILLYIWKTFGGPSALAPKGYQVQVDFDEATQLSDTADVRISGVTVGLIHGTLPHAFVLCAQPSRTKIRNREWVPIPPLDEFVRMHDTLAAPLRPAPTIAVALNTSDLSENEAREAIREAERLTGLPATDPVRYDASPIAEAIKAFHRSRIAGRVTTAV